MRDKERDKIRMENGAVIEPHMVIYDNSNGNDLNTNVLDIPELNQRKNNLSIYHDERAGIPDVNMRPKNVVTPVNLPPQNYEPPGYLINEIAALKERIDQLEKMNQDLMNKLRLTGDQGEALARLASELERERQERLKWMLEATKLRKEYDLMVYNLKKENDMLKFNVNRLEQEKISLLKALSDLKRHRDQAGIQRMQIVAIRNFLLAVELERIRRIYVDKERECEGIRVVNVDH